MALNIVLNEYSLCGGACNAFQAQAVIIKIAKIVASVRKVKPSGRFETISMIPKVRDINMLYGRYTVRDCLLDLNSSSHWNKDEKTLALALFANFNKVCSFHNPPNVYEFTVGGSTVTQKECGLGYAFEIGGILISHPSSSWSNHNVSLHLHQKMYSGTSLKTMTTHHILEHHASDKTHVDYHRPWIEMQAALP